MNRSRRALVALALTPVLVGGAPADSASFDEPSVDRWMYGANATPGRRGQASVFADPGDWSRLAQVLVGFETSASIPTGEGAERYRVDSVALVLITSGEPSFIYDDTADPVSSYFGADADPGRPLELHGVGYRNDYTADDFSDGNPPLFGEGGRNAFPLSQDATGGEVDVSSNVADGIEAAPWAIGEVVGANPGDEIAFESEVRFELDLETPHVADYVADSLNRGRLHLMVSSLQAATEQGGTFVNFYTVDSQEHFFFGGYAPRLEVQFTIEDPPPVELPPLAVESTDIADGVVSLGWQQHAGATYTVFGSVDGEDWQAMRTEEATADGPASFAAPVADGTRLFKVQRITH